MKKQYLKFLLWAMVAHTQLFAQGGKTYFFLDPPEKPLPGVKKIAVLNFDGEGGRTVADFLIAYLMKSNRGIYDPTTRSLLGSFSTTGLTLQKGGYTNIFSIVERSELDKVLGEQRLGSSLEGAATAQAGKVLGIDLILTGTISTREGRFMQEGCSVWQQNATANLKILDVKTGQVVAVKQFSNLQESKACQGEVNISMESLKETAFRNVAYGMANYISPMYILHDFEIEKIKDKASKDKGKAAMKYIDQGDLNSAFGIYKSIYESDPYNIPAIKNIAYLYAIHGNFAKADEYLKLATEVDPKETKYDVEFIAKQLQNLKALKEIGVEPVSNFEFTVVSADKALSKKVKTRGSKSDRIDARKDPDASSESVAKVPGDTEFEKLETKGDWTLVKLLGGKQGWIFKEYVR
jgi:tetratricopeptide (TPR) repeat protein